jgi:hypothetical protein
MDADFSHMFHHGQFDPVSDIHIKHSNHWCHLCRDVTEILYYLGCQFKTYLQPGESFHTVHECNCQAFLQFEPITGICPCECHTCALSDDENISCLMLNDLNLHDTSLESEELYYYNNERANRNENENEIDPFDIDQEYDADDELPVYFVDERPYYL